MINRRKKRRLTDWENEHAMNAPEAGIMLSVMTFMAWFICWMLGGKKPEPRD